MLPIEKIFLERLHKAKAEFAQAVLQHPKDKTEFGFGEASGKYKGLLLAEQLFNQVIGEEEDNES